ncbi:hypothetical protein DSM106972_032360 [Dulcicalothrix desertica PCC 7102]|uniref:Cadherin domain-containing protein n=1 Tax=Dulcicalothrix desertica PCC 7102 TaxID=232991 RepID=A0A3S1B6S5_9CYAN|nr:DUF4347 domain-containing protein [Dulcicalothrix desertica]RUT06030.1 hypothetical protein DSM106972_032360 [Dulcicalothrix desertica PCC 7102]TWH54304.1 putative delta-60 repeat protein [Dulcicalothrix desertica PCC 7102]
MKPVLNNHFYALNNCEEAVLHSKTNFIKLNKAKRIVFIDNNISDKQSLIAGVKPDIEVVILDSTLNGVEQITESLQATRYNSVHIVSHGLPGCLYLGKSPMSLSTLDIYANQLQQWFEKQELNELLLYGCNVAAGDAGEEFIAKLHHLTGASVGASANRTGSKSLGADWNLEITVGEITPVLAFKPEVLESYRFAFPYANDDFANRIILSGVSGSSTGNNLGATAETGEPTQSGTNNSIWWSWTAPSSGIVSFNTNTSKFDTYLYVYTGSSVSSLTLLKSDDDNGDGNASLVSFEAIAGTTYHIAVDGYNSATGDVTLNYAFSPNLTPGSNTAPTLTDTNVTLNTINEDASFPSGAVGTLISSLVSLGSNVNDPDNEAVTGVAITAANASNGTWYYSINNGANWNILGTVSNSSARLLAADANTRIYFRPNSNFNGTISNAITFRAWDQRFGANGDSIDTSSNGSFTAFSSATDTASITVNAVNDAPVITPNQTLDLSNRTLSNGTVVGTIIATDADAGSTLSNWVIVGGNTDRDGDGRQAFSINNTTGQIIINDSDELNPQTTPSINLQVNVSDGTATSIAEVVTIKLVPNPPGSLDSSFGTGGRVTAGFGSGTAYATAIQADGKIVVVGEAYNGSSDFAIARYNPNGTLDTNFGNGGKVTTDLAGRTDRGYSVAIQSDGKIVVAGITYNASNTTDIAVMRYNPNGTLDTNFGNGGRVVTDFDGKSDWIRSIAIQSDGKIVVGGSITVSTSPLNSDFVLVRYNPNGTLDSNFGSGGRVVTSNSNGQDSISSITIQQDGRIVAAGNVINSSGGFDFILARYNSNGSLDTSFGSSGKVTTDFSGKDDFGDSVSIQSDGKIVVAGSTGQIGVSGDFALARYNSNGSLDTNFGNSGRVVTGIGNGNDAGQSLAILANGKIVVSGFSESPSGTTYNNRDFAVAVYNPDGTVDSSFGSGGKVITPVGNSSSQNTSVAVQSDGKIVVAGSSNGDFTVIRYEAPIGSTSNTGNTGNTAPSLIDTVVTLNPVNRDAALPSGTVGTLVSSFIGIGRNVTDSNTGAVTGIAITSADSTNGTWYYSTNNGTNWNTLGTVSSTNARLLGADSNTRVYFRPNAGYTGSIGNGITFRAWDQTSGVAGGIADTSVNGGSTAFSTATDTAAITVNNPTPINDNFANQITLVGTSGSVTGTNIGATAEIGEATQSGTNNSVWWNWTAPTSGTVTFDTVGSNFDTYLSVYTGTSVNSLTLVSFNDDSGGVSTSRVSFSATAGTVYRIAVDGYSSSTGNISLNYSLSDSTTTTGNIAPTLTDTVVTLNPLNEDAGAPSGAVGTLVSSIVDLGRNVTDSRSGAVTGIAITSISTSNGTWWYSTNNGANWLQIGTLSNSNARLLAADTFTRVYFQANANYNGSISNAITFRAWNQTSGVNGSVADTTLNGGSTAFSSLADTASINVSAVNDAPVISRTYPLGIPTNATNGKIIGSLTATDIDSSNPVFSNWTIASGNIDLDGDGNMAFSINPNTGQIAINDVDDLNPRVNPTVNLQVNVSDGIVTSANENVVIKLALKSGDLDPNFGISGIVTTPYTAYPSSVAIQSDGKIVVAGGYTSFDVARYNVDGTLDTSFGNSGRVNTDIGLGSETGYSVTLQLDEKIIIGGRVWNSAQPNYPDFALARYNVDGSLDNNFGNGGKVITNFGEDFGYNVLVQSDGKIILAGFIGNGNPDYVLVRYNADGSLDTTFGNSGKVNGTNGYVAALQSDGKILVGGSVQIPNVAEFDLALARYNSDGSLDTSFGNGGRSIVSIGVGEEINSIAIQADGKIVVAGHVWKYVGSTSSNQDDLALARFNTDGSLDTSFGYGGKVITPLSTTNDDRANGLTIQPNGKIVVSGYFESGSNRERTAVLVAYNLDGTLDGSFGTAGQAITPILGVYNASRVVTTQEDGNIVLVGEARTLPSFTVARYIGTSNDISPIPTNTAPTLTDTAVTLSTVNDNAGTPSGAVGTLVSSIVSLSRNVTDPNSGGLTGLAITNANTTNGTWWYSTNNGTIWNALGQVSSTNALLLAADTFTRVYFQPNGIFSGNINNAITFRAWDQMGGTNGGTADTTINGGATAFSSATDTAAILVRNTGPTYHLLANGDFIQDWSNSSLITTDDNWDNVPSIRGFRGDNLVNGVGINPQTVLANGSTTPIDVIANQANPATNTNSGIAEFSGTIALRGSSTATAPHLVVYLDATGRQNLRLNFILKDIDTSTRDAIQPIAVQYRIGNTGDFINLPAAFVPDASNNALTDASFDAREVRLSVLLPTEINNQSQVQLRFITTDASGEDEWIGVDDIRVLSTPISANQSPVATNDVYLVAENSSFVTSAGITRLILDSDRGNYIGQSDYYSYTLANGNFNVSRAYPTSSTADNAVRVSFTPHTIPWNYATRWDMSFAAPLNAPLTAGTTYTSATRFPFQTSNAPGLDVSGDGRGYNNLNGEFTINQIIYGVGSEIISLDASFQEYGDGDPINESLKGRIQYRATSGNNLPGVLTNDTDGEKTILRATLVSGPQNGNLAFNPDGSFTYTPNAGFKGIDTFTYKSNDGITDSNAATVTLKVGVSDAPIISSVPSFAASYTENTSAIPVLESYISINDSDSPNFDTGRLTVTIKNGVSPDDRLTIRNEGNGIAQINLDGNIIRYGSIQVGTFSGTGTQGLVVNLNANATRFAVEAILRNITFSNVSDNPSTTPRTIEFVLTDGDGGASSAVTRTINVIATNDLPTSSNKTVSFNEDILYTFGANDFQFTDIDNTDTLQQVRITQLPTLGQLFLDINNDNQAVGEAITQNQIISVADLGKLKFKPIENGNGANHSNFQFRVGDGKGFSNLAYTMTLDVAAINDAPTFLIGGNQIVNPGAGIQNINNWASNFNPGAANESGQSIQSYIVEVINNSNIFKVAPTITQTGTLIYTPVDTIATSTTAQIRVSVQDNGGTANGGVDTSIPQIFTITVSGATTNMVNGGAVADAIVGTDKSDRIAGLAGNDIIYGGLGNDRIFGDAGNDTLYGDLLVLPAYGASFSMNDNIGGGSGDDLIYGNWGNDKLYGDDGNDRIWGGDGDDEIWGGLGNDILNGGTGKDTFALVRNQGVDIIEDFKVGEDVLGCAGGLRFTSLSFIQLQGDTLIRDRVNNQDVAVLKGFTGSLNSNNFRTL